MTPLETLSKWNQRAEASEVDLYKPTESTESVFRGDTPLILGRKGSGKSALLNYLTEKKADEANFTRVKFGPSLLKDWQSPTDSVMSTDQYQLRWQIFIYHTICRNAVRECVVTGSLRDTLSIRYNVQSHNSLGKTLRRQIGQIRKLKIGPTGIEIDRGYEPGKMPSLAENSNWGPYLEICRDDVINISRVTGKPCVAVFDEIDLSFDPHTKLLQYTDYVNCIKGLLACSASMVLDAKLSKHIFPIIALRSDIFEAIEGPEFNIWNGKKLLLEPDKKLIKKILAHRINHSLGGDVNQPLSFSKAWTKVFADIDDFDYMFDRSLNRLRDYVEFVRLAAVTEIEENQRRKRIATPTVIRAYHQFKEFILAEFVDEIHFKYEFGQQLVGTLSLVHEDDIQSFSHDKFVECCKRMSINLSEIEYREMVRDLFRTSVIGFRVVKPRQARPSFQYRYQYKDLSLPTEFWRDNVELSLHKAVKSALD